MVCRLPHASATQRGSLCAQVQQIQAGTGTGTDDGATGDVAMGATSDATSAAAAATGKRAKTAHADAAFLASGATVSGESVRYGEYGDDNGASQQQQQEQQFH